MRRDLKEVGGRSQGRLRSPGPTVAKTFQDLQLLLKFQKPGFQYKYAPNTAWGIIMLKRSSLFI